MRFAELLAGSGHHILRWDPLGGAGADLTRASGDFLVPPGLDLRRGEALDAGQEFLGQGDTT